MTKIPPHLHTMQESHSRSIVKGITWRIIGTLDTILLSFIYTGNIDFALQIGFIELFTKIVLYYVHERIWIAFHIGQTEVIQHPDDDNEENFTLYHDKHWRSLVKGISWRFFGTIDTIIIALFVTGKYVKAFSIGFTEIFTKVGLFYVHERIWMRIEWGITFTGIVTDKPVITDKEYTTGSE